MATKTKATLAAGRPVVVTTQHRGVFFGYAENTDGTTIKLERGRMCVYWSNDLRGVVGLASIGPSKTCKVSYPASMTLRDVTAVLEATAEAVEKWELGPWA